MQCCVGNIFFLYFDSIRRKHGMPLNNEADISALKISTKMQYATLLPRPWQATNHT